MQFEEQLPRHRSPLTLAAHRDGKITFLSSRFSSSDPPRLSPAGPRRRRRLAAGQSRHGHDVPSAGEDHEHAGQRGRRRRAAVSTTRSPASVMKPTHMIGGYAQQSYGFNYYGTVGSNRDEFIVIGAA